MKKQIVFLILLFAVFYAFPAFLRPLSAPEEFRFGEIAREMLERQDIVSPRVLNVRYFAVNPMSSWAALLPLRFLGENAFSLRLPAMLAACLTALMLGFWSWKSSGRKDQLFNTMLLYLGSGLVILTGSAAAPDMLFAMWSTGALLTLYPAVTSADRKKSIVLLAAAGILIGCGFLSRGFLAFIIPIGSTALFLLWQKKWKKLLLFPWLPLLFGSLCILPWAAAVHRLEPSYWSYFIFRRMAEPAILAGNTPLWSDMKYVLLALLPGLLPVLTLVLSVKKDELSLIWNKVQVRFLLAGAFFALIFAALPGVGLRLGLLLFLPPALLAAAELFSVGSMETQLKKLRDLTRRTSIMFLILGSLLLLAGMLYLLWGAGFIPTMPLNIAVWAPFWTMAALGAVTAGAWGFINRKSKSAEPQTFYLLFLITAAFCTGFFPAFTASARMPENELLHIAIHMKEKNIKHPDLITIPELAYPVAWCYKDRFIHLLDSPGDLKYGHQSAVAVNEPSLVIRREEVINRLHSPHRDRNIMLILTRKHAAELSKIFPRGEIFSAPGEICAWYYPANIDRNRKK